MRAQRGYGPAPFLTSGRGKEHEQSWGSFEGCDSDSALLGTSPKIKAAFPPGRGGGVFHGAFPTVCGGILYLHQPGHASFRLTVTPEAEADEDSLVLEAEDGQVCLLREDADGSVTLLASATPGSQQCCRRVVHWLCLDLCGAVKYGQGFAMQQTVRLTAQLQAEECSWLRRPCRRLVSLTSGAAPPQACCPYQAKLQQSKSPQAALVTFGSCPLGPVNPPPLVCDSSNASLLDLDWRDCLPSADLPAPCRELYAVLAQPRIDLDVPRAHEGSLVDAIALSLSTPGALLHKTIEGKMGRCFGGANPRQCYIRISVGQAQGTSPGCPLVMEIWPPGHSSPIHSHASTHGVVKVLHGCISVAVHNRDALAGDAPLQELDVRKGQVTWFSPTWYQTHALENRGSSFCCTVQGFCYSSEDSVHWPFMEFAAADGKMHDFDPQSDFTFAELRSQLLAEYASLCTRPSTPGATASGHVSKAAREEASPPALELLRAGSRPLERLSPNAKGFLVRR